MEFGYLEEHCEDSTDRKLRRLYALRELHYGSKMSREKNHGYIFNFDEKTLKERREEKMRRFEAKRQQLIELAKRKCVCTR